MATKRRPGIPHETLAFIASQAGGEIKHVPVEREMHVSLEIANQVFQAENNTALLIKIFQSLH